MRYGSRRVLVVVPLVLALAGCSDPPKTPSELTADYSTVDGEYQRARAGLKLPVGVNFPEHLPNAGDHYFPGSGTHQAQNFWLCAWLRDYLNAPPTETERARQAVAQLPAYQTMSAYTGLQPDGRQQVDAAIQGAQRGDKRPSGTFVESTCGGPFFTLAGGPGSHPTGR
jgi:hypothetical protein